MRTAGIAGVFLIELCVLTVLAELVFRLLIPQPIDAFNFTILERGAGVAEGAAGGAGDQTRAGYGPYAPHREMRFGGANVTINSHGWREREYTFEKPGDTYRIIVVGDSIVFGHGTEMEDVFHEVLERELNAEFGWWKRFEVIGLGGEAMETIGARKHMPSYVSAYAPDAVILSFNLNDVLPLPGSLGELAPAERNPVMTVPLLRRAQRWMELNVRPRSHLYHFARENVKNFLRQRGVVSPGMFRDAAFDFESGYARVAWRDTSGLLLEIRDYLRSRGVRFVLFVAPYEPQLSAGVARIYRDEFMFVFKDTLVEGLPQKVIARFCAENGIEMIDPLPLLREGEERKYHRTLGGMVDFSHPNRHGHRIFAGSLMKYFREFLSEEAGRDGSSPNR
ncbi:MAG: hypothetical protein AB1742_11565 [bacterium]